MDVPAVPVQQRLCVVDRSDRRDAAGRSTNSQAALTFGPIDPAAN